MPHPLADVGNEFRAILAPESVRAATPEDAVCGVQPKLVLEPADEMELAGALRIADDAGVAVIPRGGGTKLSWGNPPERADAILSTARLNKIVEHVWADLTVTVEAGCTIQALQSALAQHRQRLAIDLLWPERATVGGILSTNDSGALRLRFGALRDLIIGVTIALPDGTLASSGGKVVKNVAGYDIPKLVTGALGTLGVITRAVFRLHPLPHHSSTLSVRARNLDEMQSLILSVQDSQLAHISLQARTADNDDVVVDILFEGTEEGIAAQEQQFRQLVAKQIGRQDVFAGVNVGGESSDVWKAAQDLWDKCEPSAIAKLTCLPAEIARTIDALQRVAVPQKVKWKLVMQATGAGSLRLDGHVENIRACLVELRTQLERAGGSLVLRHRTAGMAPLDAWGQAGDSLPLMRAIKTRFDPKRTLNPGRFVGGI